MHWSRSHQHWFYDSGPHSDHKTQFWKTEECPIGWAFEKGKGYFHVLDPHNAQQTVPKMRSRKRSLSHDDNNPTSPKATSPLPVKKKHSRWGGKVVTSISSCISADGALHVPKNANITDLHGEILKNIENGNIKFPFKYLYFQSQKDKMFRNLQRLARDLDPSRYFRNERFSPFRVQFRQSDGMFPFTFNKSRYYLHVENESEYWDMQILTDLYSEKRRMSARRNYQSLSVLDAFRSDAKFQANIVRESLVYRPKKRLERLYADLSTQSLTQSTVSTTTYQDNTRISSFSLRECVYKCMPECT